LQAGEKVTQETLHFDPGSGVITTLRSKEEAHDYRYFPEPDLVPVAIEQAMLDEAADAIGELPAARAVRLEETLGLSAESARQLAFRAELGDYFEAALAAPVEPAPPAQALANWISSDLLSRLDDGAGVLAGADGEAGGDLFSSRVAPAAIAALVGLACTKQISVGAARQVLDRLVAEGGDPVAIVEAEGLAALDGEGDELAAIVAAALEANADVAERVRGGNAKAIGPIVGYVMRETKGRADGGEVTRLVNEQLGI
jgi:aspartyl-tRNA(Asn)/glutamyl-tRNA(Gln) amidotransferase subunit B